MREVFLLRIPEQCLVNNWVDLLKRTNLNKYFGSIELTRP